jgi:hypothetical protein
MVSATDRKAGARVISAVGASVTACCPGGLVVADLRPGAAWELAGPEVFEVEEVEEVDGPATGEGETVRA